MYKAPCSMGLSIHTNSTELKYPNATPHSAMLVAISILTTHAGRFDALHLSFNDITQVVHGDHTTCISISSELLVHERVHLLLHALLKRGRVQLVGEGAQLLQDILLKLVSMLIAQLPPVLKCGQFTTKGDMTRNSCSSSNNIGRPDRHNVPEFPKERCVAIYREAPNLVARVQPKVTKVGVLVLANASTHTINVRVFDLDAYRRRRDAVSRAMQVARGHDRLHRNAYLEKCWLVEVLVCIEDGAHHDVRQA